MRPRRLADAESSRSTPRTTSWFLMLVAGFCILIEIHSISQKKSVIDIMKENVSSSNAVPVSNLTKRAPKLADDCYHVFIDCGANIGVHGRFLFEPHKYPNSKTSVKLFAQEFESNRDNRDYCVIEMEPNPNQHPRLDEVSAAYAKMGWRYHVVKAAASDRNGTMSFHHQNDEWNNELGFGVKKRSATAQQIDIPAVRLSTFLFEEVLSRRIPKVAPSGRTYEKPKVLMKMDIEGSEYVVLPDLIHSGAMCELDLIFGETHQKFMPMQFEDHRVKLTNKQEAQVYENSLINVMTASRNCPVRWLSADDETYIRDGLPLPVPN